MTNYIELEHMIREGLPWIFELVLPLNGKNPEKIVEDGWFLESKLIHFFLIRRTLCMFQHPASTTRYNSWLDAVSLVT